MEQELNKLMEQYGYTDVLFYVADVNATKISETLTTSKKNAWQLVLSLMRPVMEANQ